MKTFAMFPGQGSQHPGMGKQLLADFPYTKEIFERAEESAKLHIRKLCFEGDEVILMRTANTQPCLFTVSLATFEVLRRETGFEADLYGGHSLGEYSALTAAGAFTLEKGVFLVRERGRIMEEILVTGGGGMSAVLNVDFETLQSYCQKIRHERPQDVVEVANENAPSQIVVAGSWSGLERLEQLLTREEKKFVRLPVGAPFHSSLMAPAREKMTPHLESSELAQPRRPVIPNFTGKKVERYQLEYLVKQIDHPVKWVTTMKTVESLGCQRLVEVGPGKVLAGLGKRCMANKPKIISTHEVRGALAEL